MCTNSFGINDFARGTDPDPRRYSTEPQFLGLSASLEPFSHTLSGNFSPTLPPHSERSYLVRIAGKFTLIPL
jgi:hypothetical protein